MSADTRPFPSLNRRVLLGCMAGSLLWPSAMPSVAGAQRPPLRIASLDYGLASTLVSLGLPPAAVVSLGDWNRWVVEPALPQATLDLGNSWEVNVEALVMLKPDLIVTTPYLDSLLPRLKDIAPVERLDVFSETGGDILPKAIAATRQLAARIDRVAEGEAFLASAEETFADYRQRLALHPRPPLALVNFMDARHVRIYTRGGLYDNALDRIGVRNAWTGPGNYWGFQTIGIEQLSEITAPDARLIAFDPVPADVLPKLSQSPLWNALPFARPGHLAVLPPALMFGMVNEALRFTRLITAHLEQTA